MYLTVPPNAPEPYKVPCGPLSTSTRFKSLRRKLAKMGVLST